MKERRTQAQKDANTVEAMYVAITGVILAGAIFTLVASPALMLESLQGEARRFLIISGKAAAAATFLIRLATGLRHR